MDPTDDKVNFRGKVLRASSRPIRLGGSLLGPSDDHQSVEILHDNTFFVPPDEFLRELTERAVAVNRMLGQRS